jgi:hypothetical protein
MESHISAGSGGYHEEGSPWLYVEDSINVQHRFPFRLSEVFVHKTAVHRTPLARKKLLTTEVVFITQSNN